MFDVISTAARIPSRTTRPARSIGLMGLLGLRRQRQQLANMTPEQLADIGITAEAAEAEANRPLWEIPSNWRA